MTDEGYTYHDHLRAAMKQIMDVLVMVDKGDSGEARWHINKARQSLTHALALIPAPDDEPEAA